MKKECIYGDVIDKVVDIYDCMPKDIVPNIHKEKFPKIILHRNMSGINNKDIIEKAKNLDKTVG